MAEQKSRIVIEGEDRGATSTFKGVFSALAAFDIAKAIVTKAFGAIRDAFSFVITAATQEQDALVDLDRALKSVGGNTDEARKQAIEFASAMQQQTRFGDEAIISAQALLVAQTKLTGEGLNVATKATLDLAAAKKIDLNTAADLVGKSIGTSTNALARYGIQAEGAAGSTKRLESVTQNLATLYGGAAAAETEKFTVKLEQYKNRFGDIAEQVGFKLIPIIQDQLFPVIEKMAGVFEKSVSVLPGISKRIELWIVAVKTNIQIGMAVLQQLITKPLDWRTYRDIMAELGEKIGTTVNLIVGIAKNGLKGLNDFRKFMAEQGFKTEETLANRVIQIRKDEAAEKTKIEEKYAKGIQKSTVQTAQVIIDTAEMTTKEEEAELDKRQENHSKFLDQLTSDVKSAGGDLTAAIKSVGETVIESDEGLAGGIKGALGGLGGTMQPLLAGFLGGLIGSLFSGLFGGGKSKSFSQIVEAEIKLLSGRVEKILSGIGKEKTEVQKQIDLLSKIKESTGGGALVPENIRRSLGFDAGTTVDEALIDLFGRTSGLAGQEVSALQSELQTLMSDKARQEREVARWVEHNENHGNRFGERVREERAKLEAINSRIRAVQDQLRSTSAFSVEREIERVEAEQQIAALQNRVPRFAGGGVVGGMYPSGDRMLVRADSGEMFLTKQQQANLLRMLDGGSMSGAPQTVTVVLQLDRKVLAREFVDIPKQRAAGLV